MAPIQTDSPAPSRAQAKPEKTRQAVKGDGFLADFSVYSGPLALESWLSSSETLMKTTFEMTRQCLDFGEARLHEDIKTLERLIGCKDLHQVADCQKAFAEKASKQYFDQFNGIAQQLAGMASIQKRNAEAATRVVPD